MAQSELSNGDLLEADNLDRGYIFPGEWATDLVLITTAL